MNKKDRVWNFMVNFAQAHDLPTAFADDLYKHDLAILEQHDLKTPFIWIIRDYGTHWYNLELSAKGQIDTRSFLKTMATCFTDNKQKWYFLWDGSGWHTNGTQDAKLFMEMTDQFIVKSTNKSL